MNRQQAIDNATFLRKEKTVQLRNETPFKCYSINEAKRTTRGATCVALVKGENFRVKDATLQ